VAKTSPMGGPYLTRITPC